MLARTAERSIVEKRPYQDVVEGIERDERFRNLKCATHAEPRTLVWRQRIDRLAAKSQFPIARRDLTGQHVEQRRLAGAVGPDDTDHLSLAYVEANSIHGDESRKTLRGRIDAEEFAIHPGAAISDVTARQSRRRFLA